MHAKYVVLRMLDLGAAAAPRRVVAGWFADTGCVYHPFTCLLRQSLPHRAAAEVLGQLARLRMVNELGDALSLHQSFAASLQRALHGECAS